MLATEEPDTPVTERGARSTLLETWTENERMRHIPPLTWIVEKLDGDLRRRIGVLWGPYADLPASDPRHPALEAEFRSLCRALDHIAETARRSRGHGHPPNDLGTRIGWSLDQAVTNLTSGDTDLFGRRMPFHAFERSNAEPLCAAVLRAICHVQRLTDMIRDIEPDIDERMYEGLVTLREPLRREPMA